MHIYVLYDELVLVELFTTVYPFRHFLSFQAAHSSQYKKDEI